VGCHHMAAVMLHANKTLSVTDQSCSWSLRKKPGDTPALPIEELLQRKRKRKIWKALKTLPTPEMLKKLKAGISKCKGAAASVNWLLSDEVTETQVHTTDHVFDPLQVIYSPEYEQCSDKVTFLCDILHLDSPTVEEVAKKKHRSG